MKIQALFLLLILLSGCNFFSSNNKNKEKAISLFAKISQAQIDLDSRLKTLTNHKNINTTSDISENLIAFNSLQNSITDSFEKWQKDFEKFKNQRTYMNYDLQLINLEKLEEDFEKIQLLVQKAENLQR